MTELNLARLQVFEAVARAGTFADAARQLAFTPSAVSQQMARLELEVGAVLVERTAKGVRLTSAGWVLLEGAERILGEAREARRRLDDLAAMRRGSLAMGSFPCATQTFAARVLREYTTRNTGIDVRLIEGSPSRNLLALHSRVQEVAILHSFPGRPIGMDERGRLVCPEEGVELRRLARDPFTVVVPDDHRLAGRSGVTIEDLADEIIVGNPRTPGIDQLLVEMDSLGIEPLFTGHLVTEYQSVRALVACGDGIGLVPRLATARGFDGTTAIPIRGRAPFRHIVVGHVARDLLSPAAGAMVELIEQAGSALLADELAAPAADTLRVVRGGR